MSKPSRFEEAIELLAARDGVGDDEVGSQHNGRRRGGDPIGGRQVGIGLQAEAGGVVGGPKQPDGTAVDALDAEDRREHSGNLGQHHGIALAAGVADPELFRADRHGGVLRQAGKRAAHQVRAVVSDDDELVARAGGEVERGAQGDASQADVAAHHKLVVAAAGGCAVQFDLEDAAADAAEVEVAAGQGAGAGLAYPRHQPGRHLPQGQRGGLRRLRRAAAGRDAGRPFAVSAH